MTVESTARDTTPPLPVPPIYDAARGSARLAKVLELAVSDSGLSLAQYRLLAFLSGGPERATALAGWLEVSPPTLTALVDGSVAKGLVERRPDAQDRRRVRHVLTPAGEQALSAADDSVAAKLQQLADHLSRAESRRLVEGLALLAKAFDVRAATGGKGKA